MVKYRVGVTTPVYTHFPILPSALLCFVFLHSLHTFLYTHSTFHSFQFHILAKFPSALSFLPSFQFFLHVLSVPSTVKFNARFTNMGYC